MVKLPYIIAWISSAFLAYDALKPRPIDLHDVVLDGKPMGIVSKLVSFNGNVYRNRVSGFEPAWFDRGKKYDISGYYNYLVGGVVTNVTTKSFR
jgi:hypothetical protein